MRQVREARKRYSFGKSLQIAAMAAILSYPVTTRAADPNGLQRFEQLLPPLRAELKKNGNVDFTYTKGSPVGDSGFALEDVIINVPADPGKPDSKPSKATIKRLIVEDLDFSRIDAAKLGAATTGPYYMKMSIQGLAIDGGMQEQMQGLGLPKTSLNLAVDYRYDEPRKVLSLNKLELQLTELASLTLTMILDGVPPPGPDTAKQAQDNTTLRTATLTYSDHSLLKRMLPLAATMGGMDVDQGVGMLRDMLRGMLDGQSTASVANGDALVSFAVDWQSPKGPLEIRLTPAPNANFAELKKVVSPDAAQKILGLVITYAGTKPGIAMASTAPAAPAPGSSSGSSGSSGNSSAAGVALCAKDNRVFVLDKDDGSLTSATIIESTSSGRCVVRFDGAAKGDDTIADTADLRSWSVDGPGNPVGSCEKEKSIIALSDGVWMPGKIKGSAAGGKCEVKLDSDDDSQQLSMNSIRVAPDQ